MKIVHSKILIKKCGPLFMIAGLLILSISSTQTVEATAGLATYDPTAQTPSLLYNEARTVYLGNLARRDNDVPPLRWNLQLTHAARWYSWDSTENRPTGFCGHQDTQGHWPDYRALFFGYLGLAGAENAFCGYVSPQDAIQGWMNSSPHRANLLDPNSREVGLGYYLRNSDGRGYVIQDFGNDPVYAPVIIENEAISTTNAAVNLYIYDRSTGGGFTGLNAATDMMVSNDIHFPGAAWEPYNANKTWALPASNGWHNVYVKTRDVFNRTLTASDSIYLGTNAPLNELDDAQMSTTQSQVTLYHLNGGTFSQVQFSLGWLADDTFPTFSKQWGNGERVNDPTAWGGTAFRLYPGDGESFAWVWDTTFISNTPLVAYFRLKVNDNTSSSEVARVSIQGGSIEYGPISLRGTDFGASNQYQEFPLNFTFSPTSNDPFLIFQFWRSGNVDVYIDAVSLFTTPQAVTPLLTWSVPGSNYRGQGVWVRYTNGQQFSAISEADTVYTFSDVPVDYWAWNYIERLYAAGITGGCGGGNYCPTNTVTRDQMAIFLLRGKYGFAYVPPAATGVYQDVPTGYWAASWIEQLAKEGITSGCSINPKNYCPTSAVTRDQMAIFLLRAKYGSNYVPPPAKGMFQDVPKEYWAADWIEQLANAGITSGCSVNPKMYCPTTPVTRDQMAVFLVRNFNLP